jgi:hypothetical protein
MRSAGAGALRDTAIAFARRGLGRFAISPSHSLGWGWGASRYRHRIRSAGAGALRDTAIAFARLPPDRPFSFEAVALAFAAAAMLAYLLYVALAAEF